MHRLTILGLAFVFALQCAVFAADDNWPQWRGPLNTGVAGVGDYPVKFSSTEGVAWKAKLPGIGTSTPIVWGDRIFVTSGIKGEGGDVNDGVLCFDTNGKERSDDPDDVGGSLSKELVARVGADQPSHVFLFSHGWNLLV